ncbi:SDR family NAD(P)-dependent oxidoreductase [Ignatzschineria sp. LJL83]
MTKPLDGKIILVTGASGAIGKESALRLADLGATIILMGRKEEKLNPIYDIIVNRGGAEPAIIEMDFLKVEDNDYYNLAQNIGQEFGKLDGIVHGAINLGYLTPMAHNSPEKWHHGLQITLNAPYFLTHAMLPLLDQSDRASVIFFAHDEVASGDKAYWGSYAIAKAGLSTMMKIFALENESEGKIAFNAIDPVCINSALRMSVMPEGATNPMELRKVIDLVWKLNDPAEPFVTGSTLTVTK